MDTIMPTVGHNSGIAAYNEFRDQLADLRKMNSDAAFDYENPKGNKDARSHVYKLRQTKAAVEKTRKDEKAESLEHGRQVDAQAKEIMVEIEAMIDVHAKPLDAIEQREADRIARHRADLDEIIGAASQTGEQWLDLPLETMKDRLAEIEAESIGEDRWEEFALEAAHAKDATITSMRASIAKREKHDAEQAELARHRAEAEARQIAEREEVIRNETRERAAKDAEQSAEAERERVAAEQDKAKADAERRELELRLAAETAERQKAEAEQRAANAEKEAFERAKREAVEQAEREAAEAVSREANAKHKGKINRAAAAALVKGGLSDDTARAAVTLIAQKAIPSVTITY